MLRRGAVHGIAGRLARLENRVSARRAVPLAIMAATGQTKEPLVISGPEVAGNGS